MRRAMIGLVVAVLVAPGGPTIGGPAGAAATEPAARPGGEAQPPIHISADAAEYFNKEGRVDFTGSVVAVQADSTLTSERMEVTFSQAPGAEGDRPGGVGEPSAGRRITQIVALKGVTFRQADPETKKERFATGEKAIYDAVERLVTMSGNPRLWEGKNLIVGEEMVFDLAEKKVNVRGKVNLTVYPDDAREAKQP